MRAVGRGDHIVERFDLRGVDEREFVMSKSPVMRVEIGWLFFVMMCRHDLVDWLMFELFIEDVHGVSYVFGGEANARVGEHAKIIIGSNVSEVFENEHRGVFRIVLVAPCLDLFASGSWGIVAKGRDIDDFSTNRFPFKPLTKTLQGLVDSPTRCNDDLWVVLINEGVETINARWGKAKPFGAEAARFHDPIDIEKDLRAGWLRLVIGCVGHDLVG